MEKIKPYGIGGWLLLFAIGNVLDSLVILILFTSYIVQPHPSLFGILSLFSVLIFQIGAFMKLFSYEAISVTIIKRALYIIPCFFNLLTNLFKFKRS